MEFEEILTLLEKRNEGIRRGDLIDCAKWIMLNKDRENLEKDLLK